MKPEGWTSWASEESLAHDTPQVEEPAEYDESRKASGHSLISEAWKELEANLVASREITKLARENEATVMKEWDNFHDYAGAREYSGTWYNLVQGHKEELAAAAKFRQQRAERAREARESREALEKVRRLREAKEKDAAWIQAERERVRAEEMAALSRGKPTPGPAKLPAKEVRPSRQKSCQRSRQRSIYIKKETVEGLSTSDVLHPGRGRRTREGSLLWAAVTRRTPATGYSISGS